MLRYYAGSNPCEMTAAVLQAAGARRTRDILSDWDLYIPKFGAHFTAELADLLPSRTDQWIGGLPGSWRLANKASLWSGVVRAHGLEEAGRLLPESWLLKRAEDRARLQAQHTPGQVYILKNPLLQRRSGLRLVSELEAVYAARQDGFTLAQRMLPDLMLIGGHRFHMRLYVLLVRREGRLSVWLHRTGRCVCAPSRFAGDLKNAEEVITRSVSTDALAPGLPFTLTDLLAEMASPQTVFSRLERLLSRVITPVLPYLKADWSFADNPAYQLLGVDAVISTSGSVQLIEMNSGPDLRPNCPRDRGLKEGVVHDLFALLKLLPRGEPSGFRVLKAQP